MALRLPWNREFWSKPAEKELNLPVTCHDIPSRTFFRGGVGSGHQGLRLSILWLKLSVLGFMGFEGVGLLGLWNIGLRLSHLLRGLGFRARG